MEDGLPGAGKEYGWRSVGFSCHSGARSSDREPGIQKRSRKLFLDSGSGPSVALGVYHGFRRKHIQAYLDEFVFRWNRRRHYSSAFDMLMDIGLRINPVDYKNLVGNPI
jgi:ISXO2-like transposase domain